MDYTSPVTGDREIRGGGGGGGGGGSKKTFRNIIRVLCSLNPHQIKQAALIQIRPDKMPHPDLNYTKLRSVPLVLVALLREYAYSADLPWLPKFSKKKKIFFFF